MLKWTEFFGGTEDEEDAEKVSYYSYFPPGAHNLPEIACWIGQNGDLKTMKVQNTSKLHEEVSGRLLNAPHYLQQVAHKSLTRYRKIPLLLYGRYNKRNDLTATAPAEHHFSVDTQVPSAEMKADGGAAAGAGLEDTSFMVGLVETDSDFLNEYAKKEAGLSDIDHHVPSRTLRGLPPQQSYLEEKFRKGHFVQALNGVVGVLVVIRCWREQHRGQRLGVLMAQREGGQEKATRRSIQALEK